MLPFYDVFFSYSLHMMSCTVHHVSSAAYRTLCTHSSMATFASVAGVMVCVRLRWPLHTLMWSCWSFSQLKLINSIRIIVRWFWQVFVFFVGERLNSSLPAFCWLSNGELCVVCFKSDLHSYVCSTFGQSAGWSVQVAVMVCVYRLQHKYTWRCITWPYCLHLKYLPR